MRAVSFALVLALTSIAGCLNLDDAVDEPDDILEEVPFLSVQTVVDSTQRTGEPSLGVAPDGTLYTNARGVFASYDEGHSWEFLGNPISTPNFDPDLFVDPDGVIWYNTLYLACNSVAVSQDGGASWFTNPAVCNGPVGDRQYVVATGDCVAYLYYHQLPTFHQTGMRTSDCGTTWIPTGPIETPDHHLLVNGGTGWGGGAFFNEETKSPYFTFSWFNDGLLGTGDWWPAAAVSRDGGDSFEVVTPGMAKGDSLGLSLVVGASDAAGNVYLAWGEYVDDDAGDRVDIMVAASSDDGATWSPPVSVANTETAKVFPAITALEPGKVAVAYYEASTPGYPSFVDEEATWNVTVAWTDDFFADEIAWEHGLANDGIVRVGPICPDGAGCTGDREFLDYFALDAMLDGRLVTVFNSNHHGDDPDAETLRNVFSMTSMGLLGPSSALGLDAELLDES